MLYAKLSKKTKKHYLCFIDAYGSIAFPTNDILNNKTLYLYGGIDVVCPRGTVAHCLNMRQIRDFVESLDKHETGAESNDE